MQMAILIWIQSGMILATLVLCLFIHTSSVEATSFVIDGPPTVAEAQQYMQQGSFEQAAAAWSAILEEDKDNGTAWFNLGYCLHVSGSLEKAIEVHRKAAEFEGFKGIALYNLGCAYSLLGDSDNAFEALAASRNAGFDMSNNADGDSDLDSIRNDPRYSVIVHGATHETLSIEETKPHSQSTQRNAPNMEEMFQFIAQRMQPIIQELMPQVHQRFAKLAEQAKMHVHEVMGQLQQRISEDEELSAAIGQIHQALSENPKFRGIMQKLQGAMGGGRGNPGVAHQTTQPSAESHEAVLLSKIEEAKADVAREVKTVVAEKVPSLSDARRFQQSGEYAEAAIAFGAILKSQPDSSSASFGYAYNLHMSGKYEAAIEAHKAAAKFENISGIANYNLGCAYALTGQADKAIDALEASAEYGFDVLGNMKSDSDLKSLRNNERFIKLQKILAGGE